MPTGPDLEARCASLSAELGGPVTCDALTADFVMFQRRRGHRHSTDDLLTAWYGAAQLAALAAARDRPLDLLDLGTGIGSIGLAVLWAARARAPGSRLTAIEAQEVSYRLLRANVEVNGLDEDVRTIHADLRDEHALPREARFDLITGSPPYFDVAAGIVSSDSQRAHARFELRGDVRDYARAAARLMAPGGRFALCFPTPQIGRALEACAAAGLGVLTRCDVIPRTGGAPLFSLLSCGHDTERNGSTTSVTSFVVRGPSGAHTEEHTRARAVFGFEPTVEAQAGDAVCVD